MIVIGIDPGATGAAVGIDRGAMFLICRFKDGYSDLKRFLRYECEPCAIYIEDVHGMPHDTGGHAFTFGKHAGRAETYGDAFDYETILVPPKKWIKELRIAKQPTKTLRKQENQRVARALYPAFAKQCTLDVADALLIAEYGRRMELTKYEV